MNANKIAKELIQRGFNVIPVNSSKMPIGLNWSKFQERAMSIEEVDNYFKPHYGIAILTGGAGRVVCLDADMKYDLAGDTWERFKAKLGKKLLSKMMCQKTVNNGYHLVFKAPENCLFGNEKLASRYTTAYEKHQTYTENFDDPDTRDKALKIAMNDSERVLFETRSGSKDKCGGYFLVAPTQGYTHVYGTVQEVTEEEYNIITETARSFSEVSKKESKPFVHGDWEIDPLEDYNSKADVLSLFVENGWKVVSRDTKKKDIRLLRPGRTNTLFSAVLDRDTKVTNFYTTSTSFETGKGYSPSGVFAVFECEGDFKEAVNKLFNMGYGKRK
jgi:hypothetical protein